MFALVSIRSELKQKIESLGLTQVEVSEKCKQLGHPIEQHHLSEFFAGTRNLSTDKLEVLAKVLNSKWKLN